MVHVYIKENQVSMFRFCMQEGSVNKFQGYWNEVCIFLIILFEKLLFIFVVQFVFLIYLGSVLFCFYGKDI
jgi:hypothetical protein